MSSIITIVADFRNIVAEYCSQRQLSLIPATDLERGFIASYSVIVQSFCLFVLSPPVRIRVRIGPPHPLVCRKRRLIGDP
jgi:hypothetical protein